MLIGKGWNLFLRRYNRLQGRLRGKLMVNYVLAFYWLCVAVLARFLVIYVAVRFRWYEVRSQVSCNYPVETLAEPVNVLKPPYIAVLLETGSLVPSRHFLAQILTVGLVRS